MSPLATLIACTGAFVVTGIACTVFIVRNARQESARLSSVYRHHFPEDRNE